MDIFQLIKQCLETAEDTPHLSVLDDYMLSYTLDPDDEDLATAREYDLDRVTYKGLIEGEQIFIGPDRQPIALKESEYKKKWVMISTTKLKGQILLAEYEKLIQQVYNQLPEALKDKVFIK